MAKRRPPSEQQNVKIDMHWAEAAERYLEAKEVHDEQDELFKQSKQEFSEEMDGYFSQYSDQGRKAVFEAKGKRITVTQVEKTEIEWFPARLEKKLEKSVARKIIRKKYSVTDWDGLVGYLKSIGADPKRVAEYVQSEKSVDEDALNQMSDLGMLKTSDVSGCYLVHSSKPYYLVKAKEQGDERCE